MLDYALRYIALGWPVLPLKGKVPLNEHGSKDATLNPDQAREWWEKWPDANIGIATGLRFFVVDIDAGGEDAWETLCGKHPPPTAIEATTGGF
jgi:hypothetical protein